MADRLGEAVVDVSGDFTQFDRDFDTEMRRVARSAAKDAFAKGYDKAGRDAAKSFSRSYGSQMGKSKAQFENQGRDMAVAFNKAFNTTLAREQAKNQAKAMAGGRGGGGWRKAGRSAANEFGGEFNKALFGPRGPVAGPIPRLFGGLTALTAGGAGIGALVTGLTSAAAAAAALVTALAPVTGILAGIPAAFGGLAAGVATLRVATLGMDEAFENVFADSAKFNESIEKLAPAAQSFLRVIRGMEGPLRTLQRSVQGAFFEPLVQPLRDLRVQLPVVQKGMTALAATFGNVAAEALKFAGTDTAGSAIRSLFTAMQQFTTGAATGMKSALNGIAQAMIAIAPRAKQAGDAVGGFLDRWGKALEDDAKEGRLVERYDRAVKTLQRLWRIGGNVAGSINNIGVALNNAFGGSVLTQIEKVTGALRTATGSPGGQAAMGGLFVQLRTAGIQLAPVFKELATQARLLLGSLASMAGQSAGGLQSIVRGLGEGLRALSEGIAAAMQAGLGTGAGAALKSIGVGLKGLVTGAGGGIGTGLSQLAAALDIVDWKKVGGAIGDVGAALGTAALGVAPIVNIAASTLKTVTGKMKQIADFFSTEVLPFANQIAGALNKFNTEQLGGKADDVIKNQFGNYLQFGPAFGFLVSQWQGMNDVNKRLAQTAKNGGNLATDIKASMGILTETIRMGGDPVRGAAEYVRKQVEAAMAVLTNLFGGPKKPKVPKGPTPPAPAPTTGGEPGSAKRAQKNIQNAGKVIADGLGWLGGVIGVSAHEVKREIDAARKKVETATALLRAGFETAQAVENAGKKAREAVQRSVLEFARSMTTSSVDSASKQAQNAVKTAMERVAAPMRATAAVEQASQKAAAAMRHAMLIIAQSMATQAVTLASIAAANAVRNAMSVIAAGMRSGRDEVLAAARAAAAAARTAAAILAAGFAAAAAAARAASAVRFGNGAIVNRATPAVIGEAGREVVIPLTRPRRAEELARQSGLLKLLAQRGAMQASEKGRRGRDQRPKQQIVNAPITVSTVSRDPSIVAHKVVSRLGRAIPTGAW